ncbi:MAG: PAS domain S-box protein [Chitinivibrionales bacterium]|nr:PAS domain S-box protein [Chitinivibrionales bacterium]
MCTMSQHSHQQIILDSIADGVFTVDGAFVITTFNRAAERITGVAREEAVGRHCWEVFHADICEGACALRKTTETGRPFVEQAVRIINSAGERVPVSISTALLRDEQGAVVGGVETFRDLSQIEELRKEILRKHTYHDIVTRDHRMLRILDTLPAMAGADTPVLVLGESGTGKEILARAIHASSPRADGPFVAVNCGALPENLLESELFGYRKGAFTDAKTDKPGRFDRAQGGTLFLDEIGDLPTALQVKLLRVVQERAYEPLGATEPVQANVRLVTATNRNLAALVQDGAFRQDLYYRINVLTVELPPLRERSGDLPLLVEHFLYHYSRVQGTRIDRVAPEAMGLLAGHDWPGNIRELENVLQHAFIMCPAGRIEKGHLPEYLAAGPPTAAPLAQDDSMERFEADRIRRALERNRYSRSRTAHELGIHPSTLWRKMKRLGIE